MFACVVFPLRFQVSSFLSQPMLNLGGTHSIFAVLNIAHFLCGIYLCLIVSPLKLEHVVSVFYSISRVSGEPSNC